MTKHCPNCKEVDLKMTMRQGVEIDYCPDCNGIWLDNGELSKIIDRYVSQAKSTKKGNDIIIKRSSSSKLKTTSSVIDSLFDIFDLTGE